MRQIGSMVELRRAIDALDAKLVSLLAQRSRLIDRAAELKPGEGLPARIEARVEAVVAHVRACAEAEALEPELVEALWRLLIDWSIRREEAALGSPGKRD